MILDRSGQLCKIHLPLILNSSRHVLRILYAGYEHGSPYPNSVQF